MLRLAILILALSLPVAASAQDCDLFGFSQVGAQATLARVSQTNSKGRLAFHAAPHCLSDCITKAHLLKGDEVLVGGHEAGLACVIFKPKRPQAADGTVGWLPEAALSPIATPPPRWTGYWIEARRWGLETSVILRAAGVGRLAVEGSALWASSRDAIKRGSVNTGELEGEGEVRGSTFGTLSTPDGRLQTRPNAPDDYDCHYGMAVVGDWLLVVDNLACGGANVTFTGVYRRHGPPPPPRPET